MSVTIKVTHPNRPEANQLATSVAEGMNSGLQST